MLEANPKETTPSARWWLPAVLVVTLVAGSLLAWEMAKRTDHEMRRDLLEQADLAAQAISVEDIKALSGTESDLNTPRYLQLKSQFARLRSINSRCRHLYAMGRMPDGRVFFYLDSEPIGSADESPAGQIYTEIPPEFMSAFIQKKSLTAGPITDRWGTWVTALVPLRNSRTGEVIAVLGMDIDAHTWQRDVFVGAVLPPALFALALTVTLLVGRFFWSRRVGWSGDRHQSRSRLMLAQAGSIGLILTLAAAWTFDRHESWVRNKAFSQLAASRTAAIAETLRDLRDQQLESLARFYTASVAVEAEEFVQFTGHLTRSSAIQAWQWVPSVSAAERDRFEAAAQAEGMRGFRIWEMDAQGRRSPAAERDIYYPVFRTAPTVGNEPALGFDLGSEPLRRSALTEAARTGLPVATDPIILVQDRERQPGMLFVRPVFKQRAGPDPIGFALAVVRPDALLSCARIDRSLLLELELIKRDGRPTSLTGSSSAGTTSTGSPSLRRPLLAFGKVFAVRAHAGPEFTRLYPRRAGLAAGLTGLLLTAAALAVVSATRRRHEELERLVSERTSRVIENEKRLDLFFTQSLDGFFFMMLDEPIVWNDTIDKQKMLDHVFCHQRMTRVNQAMLDQYGAKEEDFVGRTPHDLFKHDLEHGYHIWRGLFDRGRWHVETDQRRLDGTPIRISGDYICIYDDEGRITGHFGVQTDITERSRGELEMLRAKEQFELAVLGSNDGIWDWDLRDNSLFLSPRWKEQLGYRDHELPCVFQSFEDRIHPDDKPRVMEYVARYLKGEVEQYEIELRMRHKSGSYRWILARGEAIRDEKGVPYRMAGSHTDITEQKRAQSELAESEQRFSLAISGTGAGLWDWDMVKNTVFFSLQWKRMLGYEDHEVENDLSGWRNLWHPEEAARIEKAINDHIEGRTTVYEVEHRLRHKDGSWHWILTRGDIERDAAGKPVRWTGTNIDITDRKQVEAAQREGEARLRSITDTARDAIIMIDDQGTVSFWNPAAETILGYSCAEALGHNLHDLVAPERFHEAHLQAFSQFVRTGRGAAVGKTVELAARRKDGVEITIALSLSAVSHDGKWHAVGILRDITEQKQVEVSLRESEAQLREAQEIAKMGRWDYDHADNRLQWTDTIYSIFEIDREKFGASYEAFLSAIHPDDRDRVDAAWRQSLEDQKSYCLEHRLLMIDGRVKWVSEECVTTFDSDGRPRHTTGIVQDITERKRAEEKLQQALQIVDNVQIGLYLYHLEDAADDRTLRMIYANPATETMTGLKPADIVGKTLDENFPGLRQMNIPQRYAAVVRDGKARVFEDMLYGDGRIVQAAFSVKAFPLPGNHVGIAFEDITERKHAERKIETANRRLEEAQTVGNVGSWEFDFTTDRLRWSDQTFRIYGESRESFKPTFEAAVAFYPDGDREAVLEALNTALQGDGILDIDHRIVRRNGTTVFVHESGRLTRAHDGSPLRMTGCVVDITERKRAEETLRESEQKYSAVISGISSIVWRYEVDEQGDFVSSYISPVADRLLGLEDGTIGDSFDKYFSYVHPEDLSIIMNKLHETLATLGRGVSETYRLRKSDGSILWVLTSGSTELQPNGHIVAFGATSDITNQKQAELALLNANRELEKAIAQANQLAIQAEIANIAKSEFLANMSHEIRTPMNGVIGMTDLLLDTELDTDQRRFAEIVRSSGESLLTLINDILDFSKIEAGKLECETIDFDLENLLDDLTAALAVKTHEKGLEIICGLDPEVPTLLRGDPGRLRQILTNLAGNAVKFTHEGEVAIRITLLQDDPQEARLRFSVHDTGIGIPRDKHALLFQQFTQVDASATRQYGGTGLGLAIAKQLVEMMDGEIGVSSEEGLGSEFWFTARLAKQNTDSPTPYVKPAEFEGLRVLVVDDNATNREILTATLGAWGLRVSTAADGPDALQTLYGALDGRDPFRLAILDMQMPGMDGKELGRAIRADERLGALRLMLLSSMGTHGDIAALGAIGFDASLTKPVRRRELKTALARMAAQDDERDPNVWTSTEPATGRASSLMFADRHARILLAEDNDTNRQVALGILSKLGLSADAVGDGLQAVKALKETAYDLVLMDVQMPEMDGLKATRRIRDPRSGAKNREVPIIAMTAHAMRGDREKCLQAGMNDYVSKPISPQALAETLDRWLPPAAPTAARMPAASAPAQQQQQQAQPTPPVAPAEESLPEVWDHPTMMDRLMGDDELAAKVIKAFLSDIPGRLAALARALDDGDGPNVVLQAHTIKGSAANVGADQVSQTAARIEQAGRSDDLEAARTDLLELNDRFDRFQHTVNEDAAILNT